MNSKTPLQEAINKDDHSDAVATMLGELMDKSPRPANGNTSSDDHILNKAIGWIQALRHRGFEIEAVAQDFYNRCRSDQHLLKQSGFFNEERAIAVSRIQRSLSGLTNLLEKRLPMELRKTGSATFVVKWSDASACGEWEGAPKYKAYNFRQVVLNAVQLFGKFDPSSCSIIADRILRDVRAGDLVVPKFHRDKDADLEKTILHWIKPGLEIPADLADSLDSGFDFEGVLPDEKELAFWNDHPEMVQVFDQLVCSTVVQNFQLSVAKGTEK